MCPLGVRVFDCTTQGKQSLSILPADADLPGPSLCFVQIVIVEECGARKPWFCPFFECFAVYFREFLVNLKSVSVSGLTVAGICSICQRFMSAPALVVPCFNDYRRHNCRNTHLFHPLINIS